MAPPSADDSTLPRRSARATVALILCFFTMAGLTIIGHLDRINAAPAEPDPAEVPIAGIVVDDRPASGERDGTSVHLVAPAAWKQALAPGSAFQFHVDQTGHRHLGHVRALDDSSDPAHRTVRVIGTLHDDDATLLPGMSGSARFRPARADAGRY